METALSRVGCSEQTFGFAKVWGVREVPFSRNGLMGLSIVSREVGYRMDKEAKLQCAMETGRRKKIRMLLSDRERAASWVAAGNSIYQAFRVSWNSE